MKESPLFVYGAGTSSHQVEGNNIHNDWWEWERTTPGAHPSGRAADHKKLYKEDFALAKSLGHTAHRISIEWSRIEPKEGQWDMDAVAHYRSVLQELRKLKLQSFVTLHHFTNPLWFAKKDGWEVRANTEYFLRYVRFISQQLGELVDVWVTINEPMVYSALSFWEGRWPPQKKSIASTMRVIWNMAAAHKKAYRIIHTQFPNARVGIAKHSVAYKPEHKTRIGEQIVSKAQGWWFNHMFFQLTGATHDYIGVNYYVSRKKRVQMFPLRVETIPFEGPKTDLGWPIDADGLFHVLVDVKKYGRPIYILENGLADAKDAQRADYIRSHLRAVEAAQAQGVEIGRAHV